MEREEDAALTFPRGGSAGRNEADKENPFCFFEIFSAIKSKNISNDIQNLHRVVMKLQNDLLIHRSVRTHATQQVRFGEPHGGGFTSPAGKGDRDLPAGSK